MKRARVIVLCVAFTAAIGAAWIAKKIVSGPREVQQVERTVGATDVLVAANPINLGDSIRGDDLKWQEWPVQGVTPGLITRDAQPDAPTKLSGAVARAPFIVGEPIKEQKLIKVSEGGVMAAILPAGMRAISTPIREETSAGGFILPNDRVDVILSHKMQVGSKEEPVSEAVLRNVRVLAIGQEIETKGDDKVATGKTATLELTPRQAEILTLAQSMGDISLSLRSLADSTPNGAEPVGKLGENSSGSVKFLKYGVPSRALGVN
ncbi:MAG: Flp pilus assembly protein CpaB [Methyloceanibacter sp.]